MRYAILMFCFLLTTVSFSASDTGYEIEVKINNLSNQEIFLGHHFGGKLYVSDTTMLNTEGYGVFEDNEALNPGLYLIFLPSKKYFDIIVDENQSFYIENDTTDFVKNIKIKNSPQNTEFYEYQKFLMQKQNQAKELNALKDQYSKAGNQGKLNETQEKYAEIDKEVNQRINKVINDNQGKFIATLMKLSKEVKIPDPPKDSQGNITDSTFQYRYFKNHYLDNVEFQDERILRTPFYERKLKSYISALPQIPDTLRPIVDNLIDKTRGNDEVFRFTVSYLFNYFINSKIMGMDAMYAHIGEKYYLSGEADWADEEFISKLRERISKIKPNLIGNKAPELKLMNNYGEFVSLHEINAKYTVVVFWEPNCGHCGKAVPKLYDIYQKYSENGLDVFAVYTQNKKEEWDEFIQEKEIYEWHNVYDPYFQSDFRNKYDIYSTPTVYLLNQNKEIIAKRLSVEDIEKYLESELN